MKKELPLVSIVTPSLNQGRFIEETILSVKNQIYPHIEHVVIDGGSTDSTLDILRKYSDSIIWISEPDKGHCDAINKGWRIAKGEILAFLNSDDTYLPWTVETVVEFLTAHPDVSMVYGDGNQVYERGEFMSLHRAGEFDLKQILCWKKGIPQPTMFFKREVFEKVGYLDPNIQMGMEFDYYIRIGLKLKVRYIPQTLATIRIHPGGLSVSQYYKCMSANFYALDKFFSNPELPKELRVLKRQAYSGVHRVIGIHSLSLRQMGKARKHLIKAFILYPQYYFPDVWLFGYLVSSLLGSKATNVIVKWKRKLIDKH